MTEENVMVKDQGLAERNAALAPSPLRGGVSGAASSKGRPGQAPEAAGLFLLPMEGLPPLGGNIKIGRATWSPPRPGAAGDGNLTPGRRGFELDKGKRAALGLAVVAAAMMPLFVFPKGDFALSTFIATGCMVAVAVASGGYRRLFAPRAWTLALGLASAAGLYALFYAGNLAIGAFHPLGVGAQAETSIYALIASSGNPLPLQVLVLAFDSVGFESYFRGTLQSMAAPRLGRAAPFAVAAVDALIHVASFNILWVVATFLADSVWGLTYYRTGDLSSSMLSHFVWDVAIFMIAPIG